MLFIVKNQLLRHPNYLKTPPTIPTTSRYFVVRNLVSRCCDTETVPCLGLSDNRTGAQRFEDTLNIASTDWVECDKRFGYNFFLDIMLEI